MRSVKKDGNCFYRALAYALSEYMMTLHGSQWHQYMQQRASQTKDLLSSMGYDMDLFQDFYDLFHQSIQFTKNDTLQVEEFFNTEYMSDTVVCYFRLVTAAILKRDSILYEAFILDSFPSIQEFSATQVEPMNVESDQIHIVAMSNALGIDIKIANLDPSPTHGKGINYHEISPMEPSNVSDAPVITLLYRPGHYDILYPK